MQHRTQTGFMQAESKQYIFSVSFSCPFTGQCTVCLNKLMQFFSSLKRLLISETVCDLNGLRAECNFTHSTHNPNSDVTLFYGLCTFHKSSQSHLLSDVRFLMQFLLYCQLARINHRFENKYECFDTRGIPIPVFLNLIYPVYSFYIWHLSREADKVYERHDQIPACNFYRL